MNNINPAGGGKVRLLCVFARWAQRLLEMQFLAAGYSCALRNDLAHARYVYDDVLDIYAPL